MRTPRIRAARWPMLFALLAVTHFAGATPVTWQAAPEPHRPIPQSLLEEHAELHTSLEVAVQVGGPIGDAARQVLAVVEPHMAREQRVALPPLRLLPRLASGEMGTDMTAMLAVTEQLRTELPTLRKEHVAIKRALEVLWAAAWGEGKPEYAFLAQRINHHVEVDEEVLYPAALVVGDYLRLRLVTPPAPATRPPTE